LIRILYTIGWIMALIGGLILILLGLAAVFGIFFFIFYPLYSLGAFFWGIIIGIGGLISVISARFVHRLGTAILLILVGLGAAILGAWIGAWLVVLGAVLGLLSRL
jgi:hypothetical protein